MVYLFDKLHVALSTEFRRPLGEPVRALKLHGTRQKRRKNPVGDKSGNDLVLPMVVGVTQPQHWRWWIADKRFLLREKSGKDHYPVTILLIFTMRPLPPQKKSQKKTDVNTPLIITASKSLEATWVASAERRAILPNRFFSRSGSAAEPHTSRGFPSAKCCFAGRVMSPRRHYR